NSMSSIMHPTYARHFLAICAVTHFTPPLLRHIFFFFFYCYLPHRHLHSFPTRRSSDLAACLHRIGERLEAVRIAGRHARRIKTLDRKSTRLNSSHGSISYAVFCLKKKKKKITITEWK